MRLNALLQATDAIHSETETAQDLRFLLGAGSPLGCARPKSAVSLTDDRLAIAKFPKPDDTRDIGAGEILALTLAEQAGIQVAEHRLVPVGSQSVAVITRFDRAGKNRIPFIFAATLLGLPQGDSGAYTLLADGVRQFGNDVTGDLRELWRRFMPGRAHRQPHRPVSTAFRLANQGDHSEPALLVVRNGGKHQPSKGKNDGKIGAAAARKKLVAAALGKNPQTVSQLQCRSQSSRFQRAKQRLK